AVTHGVVFMLDHNIQRIESSGDRVIGIATDKGKVEGDAYVLALGSFSPVLARPLGVKLPVYPIKGYSLTLPIVDLDSAPTIGGVDEANLVAYARLGKRLRLTATADFAGYDTGYDAGDFAVMLRVALELFPTTAAYDRPD